MGLVSSYLCNCSLWEQRECDIQYTHTGCVHDNYDLYPVSYSWTVASFSIFSKKDCITPISTIAPFLVCDRLLSVLPASLSSSHFMTISYELKSFFVLNDLGLQPFLQIRAQGGKKKMCVCDRQVVADTPSCPLPVSTTRHRKWIVSTQPLYHKTDPLTNT